MCPVFVARDLSGFRAARKGGGEWAGRKCCKGYDRCVSRGCSSGMSGASCYREKRRRRWGCRSERSGAGVTGCATKGPRACAIGGSASRRAAAEEILRMLGLYEERYSGFTVKHFHEQLHKRHHYKLGYTVTRLALQGRGWCGRRRGARRIARSGRGGRWWG